jgi:hypothetical protein
MSNDLELQFFGKPHHFLDGKAPLTIFKAGYVVDTQSIVGATLSIVT